MASPLKVVMFLGSTREGRMGARVATFMKRQMEGRNMKVELLDPKELDIPLLQQALHFYSDPSKAPAVLHECDAKIRAADAFVVVSAEYNAAMPPALTNIMDHFSPAAYAYKPSGIVTYSPGSLGGARAAMMLRVFLTELGCLPVHETLGMGSVHDALDDKGVAQNDDVVAKATKLIAELEWMANAMKNHRQKVTPPNL